MLPHSPMVSAAHRLLGAGAVPGTGGRLLSAGDGPGDRRVARLGLSGPLHFLAYQGPETDASRR